MSRNKLDSRTAWLVLGMMAGLGVSFLWPHEPTKAAVTDRGDKFALATVPVKDITIGGFRDSLDGVFVLDFLTGRLTGGVLNNKTGQFWHRYFRNVAADFNVNPEVTPQYAIVSGTTGLAGRGGVTPANGTIYVAELTSGKIIAYTFPYAEARGPIPPIEMQPLHFFPFREAVQAQ
ncbi:MAG: hypothetical protein KY476_15645 [Planctomycetes bacterium]|nr:hypothetical protein [Planctomycetota bacterium]